MDRYLFPHITHISQCLQAIKGCDAFHVAERDRHTIISYHNMGNDTFPPVNVFPELVKMIKPDREKYEHRNGSWYAKRGEYDVDAAIRRECRGIVFGEDGRVIARRLHKFFNAGEREEVAVEGIDLTAPHVVLEKLDGSMITPIPIGDHVRWGTKMGLTEVGFQAEEYVSTRRNYVELAEYFVKWGWTPIFEWCSRKQRIVVDYPEDKLVLIAIRNNVTGEYQDHASMKTYGRFWKVPVVEEFMEGWKPTVSGFLEVMKEDPKENFEGYVVRFEDGHSVKLKYEDYVRIHRAKDSIMQEKRVIEMVLAEKVDDVLPHLIPADRDALSDFQMDFWIGMLRARNRIYDALFSWCDSHPRDRKSFAVGCPMDPKMKGVCFAVWDKPIWYERHDGKHIPFHGTAHDAIMEEMTKRVAKKLGSQSSVDEVRWMWESKEWKDYLIPEEAEAA